MGEDENTLFKYLNFLESLLLEKHLLLILLMMLQTLKVNLLLHQFLLELELTVGGGTTGGHQ